LCQSSAYKCDNKIADANADKGCDKARELERVVEHISKRFGLCLISRKIKKHIKIESKGSRFWDLIRIFVLRI
jgi:hypothetical protein